VSPELKEAAERLAALAGARPRVLPPPYACGHFSLHGVSALPNEGDFIWTRRGETVFAAMADDCLARLLLRMDARTPRLDVEPARSPLYTLLHQILDHGFVEAGADCPYLMRLCLDLDGDAGRAARTLRRLEEGLGAHYARVLSQGRKHSLLPAVARQIVYHRETLAALTNGGN
jgi:hypothetical protein